MNRTVSKAAVDAEQGQLTASSDEPSEVRSGPLAGLYRRFLLRRLVCISAMAAALLVSFLTDVALGPAGLSLSEVVKGLLDHSAVTPAQAVILWDVRLPYAVMAAIVGAALGLAGAEVQTVLNNPLASPFTLGILAAATLGASIAIVFDIGIAWLSETYIVPACAFLCALVAIALLHLLARAYGASVDTVILFGIAMVFALNAVVAFIQFLADSDSLQQVVFWTMGSLTRASWDKIAVVAAVFLLCAPLSMRQVWTLTALRGGEDHAASLGIRVERVRLFALLRAGLLSATAVAFVGTIGFVGLVGPHIARLALGEDHRFFLPGSALAGALVLSLASIASKSVIPGLILPVGIVTALVGIPLFMALVLTQRRGA